MKRVWIVFFLIIAGNLTGIAAGTAEKITDGLRGYGFENVRVALNEKKCLVTLENPVYRWNVDALVTAIGFIVENVDYPVTVEIIFLEKGVPKVTLAVESEVWNQFRKNEITENELSKQLFITEETSDNWEQIKNQKAVNRHIGKIDLVIYPQFAFENTLKDRIYEYQFNLAPAIQLSLWKGMNFTGQVIFPIYNELGYEGDFVRPGQVFVSQEVKLKRFGGKFSVGNFSSNRYGADLWLRYIFPAENWNLKINTGYTGSSHFLNNEWKHTPIETFTGSASATWFMPRFNIEFEGGVRRYIYGDTGIFGNCTRWFREVAIGFYVQAGTEDVNGGFFCTIPFPIGKRNRKHFVRVIPPEYLDFSYNAGTEFYYGQSYQVDPANNRVNQFFNAGYLKNQIVNYRIVNRK